MKKTLFLGARFGMIAAIGAMTANERRLGRYLRDGGGHPAGGKSAEQLAEDLRKKLDEKQDAIKKVADDALTEAKRTGTLAEETKATADKTLTELSTLKEQLAQIEQKMARRPGGDGEQVKSYGEQVTESDRYKSYLADGARGNMRIALKATDMDIKAITAAQSGTAWSARDNEVVAIPRRTMTIRSLLNVVRTSSGSIDYARQITRTNNAAVVAEGAQKPTSTYVWEQTNVPVRTIAHIAKLTRQAIDDSVQLQGEVESEMRYGLSFAEEDELLNGDSTGQHLSGLITNASDYAAPIVLADMTMIDVLRLALLQAELALYPTDGIVLNPMEWAAIELTKTTEGTYVFANPLQLAGPRLWGKPVVATPALAAKKFLTGGFKLQTLYDRMEPEVVIASENADDFEKNLYTMRCEERIALAVKRAAALIYGDFDEALAA